MNEFTSGLVLMATGMSVVFVFLVLMIVAMTVMSKIIVTYFPEKLPPAKKPGGKKTSGGPSPDELAAITTAVHEFIRSRK